ncbi:nitrogen fixation protein FixH [Arthrobacter pigmenti]|uniref:Nitrogen fixation protein FixH n=1 Tax=Arthrobacter pigmenti TaxID=271432 RepID=A0A846RSX1_9MICC|nr:SHOCT domain-containing protein [Arthrobacter pigmenti]NJC23584.1 nitrogen fixation protein FixH [Arthrobacter pigmenti]
MQIQGWHIVIILALLTVVVVPIVIALAVAAGHRRRSGLAVGSSAPHSQERPASKETRLAELEDLRQRRVITDEEYRKAREDILRN